MSAQDDEAATRLVLAVLGDQAINEIDFQMGAIAVSAAMYRDMSQAITDGKIAVWVAPNLLTSTQIGKYFSELRFRDGRELFDILVLRFPDLGSGINEQVKRAEAIVHECTHGGFALRRVPNMTRTLHEAGAYTAQSTFTIAKMLSRGGHPENVTSTITQPIEKAAWNLAILLSRRKAAAANTPVADYFNSPDFASVVNSWWNAVYTAIAASNEYGPVANDPVQNVGLGRQWITQPRTP